VPDIAASFDHLVGAGEQRWRRLGPDWAFRIVFFAKRNAMWFELAHFLEMWRWLIAGWAQAVQRGWRFCVRFHRVFVRLPSLGLRLSGVCFQSPRLPTEPTTACARKQRNAEE
jgi:hypothetical protein